MTYDARNIEPLENYIEGWRKFVKKRPGKRWGMAKGFKMFDYVALEILEAQGEIGIDWDAKEFWSRAETR